MNRIICIGNRLIAEDRAGSLVHDRLQQMTLPPDVEVIDGGVGGLNLLKFLDHTEHVVFVDSVRDLAPPNSVVVLKPDEIFRTDTQRYDHSTGLEYLLRVLPNVCEGSVPQITIVGIEGKPDDTLIDQAAWLALGFVA